ncbi:unnamed protein product [Clonostachys rosea f. rosea IK726]|uniref:Uncharacterized protein n=1 Tax=Clonostachys rosea f. rosea IK726 TaxID=1349383 RepID=A0ACA9TX04_BIOOC|nr:unnamed protein product [Clonostachys rosea f. rosea IK726]
MPSSRMITYESGRLNFLLGNLQQPLKVYPVKVEYDEDCVIISGHTAFAPPELDFPPTLQIIMRDPRYAGDLRKQLGLKPWTVETEQDLLAYMATDGYDADINLWSREPSLLFEQLRRSPLQHREACFRALLIMLQTKDARAYDHAYSSVQGLDEPARSCFSKYLGSVSLDISNSVYGQPLVVYGTVTEFVPGFTADELCEHIPRHLWHRTISSIISTIHTVIMNATRVRHDKLQAKHFTLSYCHDKGGVGSRIVLTNLNGFLWHGSDHDPSYNKFIDLAKAQGNVFDQLLQQVDDKGVVLEDAHLIVWGTGT